MSSFRVEGLMQYTWPLNSVILIPQLTVMHLFTRCFTIKVEACCVFSQASPIQPPVLHPTMNKTQLKTTPYIFYMSTFSESMTVSLNIKAKSRRWLFATSEIRKYRFTIYHNRSNQILGQRNL